MRAALRHVRSVFVKDRPVHLTYFVTRRCNGRCPFCLYERARDLADGPPELSLDEVRRVAGSMGPLLWVLFSGGEPFLRDDLAELAGLFHDLNAAAFLTVPTNGLLPEVVAARTEAMLRRCRRSVVVVKVSLDGVGEEHDRLRRAPGGFARALETCRLLADLARRHPRLELGVNTVFCAENQSRMEGIIDLVRELDGVRSHTISMVRGELRDRRYLDVDLDLYAGAIRRLETAPRPRGLRFHRFAGGRLKAAQDRLQRRLVHRTLLEKRRVLPCYAGRLNLVLTEGGELFPCEGRWDRSFGNVRDADHDVAALLRTARAASIRRELERGGCHCSHECNLMTNVLFNPRAHPGLAREYAALRLGVPALAAG